MGRYQSLEDAYYVEYDLGQGTFGKVQVVKDRTTGCKRICKTISKMSKTFDVDRARAELDTLQSLRHPNINSLVEFLEDDYNMFLILEHNEGGDAQELLDRLSPDSSWLDENTVALYIRQLLVALAYCHSSHILHRDLKPGSMGFTSRMPDAQVKVQDFGLAAIFDPHCAVARSKPTIYHPPETFVTPNSIQERADLYSVGSMTYMMLINLGPFDAKEPNKLIEQITHPDIKFFADDGWTDRSTMSRDFIRSLMSLEPTKRMTAAQALNHPWIQKFAVAPGLTKEQIRGNPNTLLVCAMSLLKMTQGPVQELERLHHIFVQMDLNQDGYVSRGEVGQMFRGTAPDKKISKVLDIVDFRKVGVICYAGLAVASFLLHSEWQDIIANHHCAEAFQIFAEGQPMTSLDHIRNKLKTPASHFIEQHGNVSFTMMLRGFPADRPIDMQMFHQLTTNPPGRGTPFLINVSSDDDDEDDYNEDDLDALPILSRVENYFSSLLPFSDCWVCQSYHKNVLPHIGS